MASSVTWWCMRFYSRDLVAHEVVLDLLVKGTAHVPGSEALENSV